MKYKVCERRMLPLPTYYELYKQTIGTQIKDFLIVSQIFVKWLFSFFIKINQLFQFIFSALYFPTILLIVGITFYGVNPSFYATLVIIRSNLLQKGVHLNFMFAIETGDRVPFQLEWASYVLAVWVYRDDIPPANTLNFLPVPKSLKWILFELQNELLYSASSFSSAKINIWRPLNYVIA